MKERAFTISTVIIIIFLAFSMGYFLGQSPWAPYPLFGAATATPDEAKETFEPFWEAWDIVHARYYDLPVDDELLTEGAIDGMLAVLGDDHTRYLSPQDEEVARQAMSGEFQGIGAEVEGRDGFITVVSPIDGSPAAAADLRPGDRLLEADGVDLFGMDVSDAAALVRGPAGTAVLLLVERGDEQFELEIVRAVVELKSVRSEILEDNIAYLRLNRFGEKSAEELSEALEDLMTTNPDGLILDLRRNPGGSLTTAVDIADEFLPQGPILIERFGNDSQRLYEATNKGMAEDIPLVVLIDEGSASASEVLAGAIRDEERGILIGQTTFGKGTVQTWQSLSNGGGLRLTIARWLTPNETWVHKEGLDPDFFIPLPEFDADVEFEDTQLQAAIDFLLGETIISVPPELDESEG